jgi:AbrB family looped-hinge helix DNA binding protein
MTTTLSSKGQVVLPRAARQRLGLKPGVKFDCRVKGNEIVLRPQGASTAKPRLIRDKVTGMVITKAPQGASAVTGDQVRALMADFP